MIRWLGARQAACKVALMEAKGVTGNIVFDGQMVTIKRTGAAARMIHGQGEKSIPVTSIAAVQWKPPTWASRGFIQFTIPGGNEQRSLKGSRTMDAAGDENSVLFSKTQMPEFERLRVAIETARRSAGSPTANSESSSGTATERLSELTAMRVQGLITDEEFETKKAAILGSI
jgi:hypothetical protein